jgi:polysaccharide pyruvyl transferase CsaB
MRNKRILISGYYGFDNFGDDAVLYTLLSGLKENDERAQITVISKNPDKIKELYGVNSIKTFDFAGIARQMLNSDLFISGGGSLLQDATSLNSLLYYLVLIFFAQLLCLKTFIYAQGIGPIKNEFGLNLTKFILKRVNKITVRDQQSKDFLANLGIESVLTADPVWNVESPRHPELVSGSQDLTKIGIQLRDWKSLDDSKLKNLAESIAENFSDEKYEIILISLQDSLDLAVTQKFEGKLKQIKPDLKTRLMSGLSISQAISALSSLNYLIGMRYHACLVSIKFAIPVLPISYDPKVESLATEAEIPYIKIDELNDKEVLGRKILELKDENFNYKSKLEDFSAKKQLESRQNIDLLVKILM